METTSSPRPFLPRPYLVVAGGEQPPDAGTDEPQVTGVDTDELQVAGVVEPRGPVASNSLTVSAWPDPVIDKLGYDPRSAYVEKFWLGILGPSTTWLMRRVAAGLDANSEGFVLDMERTARSLGLGGKGGRHGPFQRSISRLVTFELAKVLFPNELAVRRFIPPLPRRHLMRLDTSAQEEHRLWLEAQKTSDPEVARIRLRARRVALGLFSLGDSYAMVESELLGWHLHPALASDATSWAWRQSGAGGAGGAGGEHLGS